MAPYSFATQFVMFHIYERTPDYKNRKMLFLKKGQNALTTLLHSSDHQATYVIKRGLGVVQFSSQNST